MNLQLDEKALAIEIANQIAPHLASQVVDQQRFYNPVNSPLGKHLFMDCARRGCFKTFRVARRNGLLALREEVDAWIMSQPAQFAPAREQTDEDEVDRALAAAVVDGSIAFRKKRRSRSREVA